MVIYMIKWLIPKNYPSVILTKHNPESIKLYNEAFEIREVPFYSKRIVDISTLHNSTYYQIVTGVECTNCHKKIHFIYYKRLFKFANIHPSLKLNIFTPKFINIKWSPIERRHNNGSKR